MIKAIKIILERAEGPSRECGEKVVEGADVWTKAQAILCGWAHSAPGKGGKKAGYDKCDFKVFFEDGEEYEGRYDLMHLDIESPDLARHVRDFVQFYTGKHKPYWMKQESYDDLILNEEKANPGYGVACENWLASYELGDPISVPVLENAVEEIPLGHS